jgi:hypothetical protein
MIFLKTRNNLKCILRFNTASQRGGRLLTSQADSISPGEWRFTREQKVMLSFVRDKDGLIRPWTHAEFEANQKLRHAKLSRE